MVNQCLTCRIRIEKRKGSKVRVVKVSGSEFENILRSEDVAFDEESVICMKCRSTLIRGAKEKEKEDDTKPPEPIVTDDAHHTFRMDFFTLKKKTFRKNLIGGKKKC